MKFPKPIIDEFVSWIDLKDVKDYARLQKAKESKRIIITGIIIQEKSDLEFVH